MGATGGDKDVAQQPANALRVEVVGEIVRTEQLRVPSTVSHSQPERKVALTCGRRRRLASFTGP